MGRETKHSPVSNAIRYAEVMLSYTGDAPERHGTHGAIGNVIFSEFNVWVFLFVIFCLGGLEIAQ